MILWVTVSELAWDNLKTLSDHSHRRPEVVMSGNRLILIPHGTTAKGLSNYLTSFLINPHPAIATMYYDQNPPYFINPEHFVDCRIDAQYQYEEHGYPSQLPIAIGGAPTWIDLDSVALKHMLSIKYAVSVLNAASKVATYWHLANRPTRLPKTQQEQLSALLNALGNGALRHPLLPKNWPDKPLPYMLSMKDALAANKLPDILPQPQAPYVHVPQYNPQIRKRSGATRPNVCQACQQNPPAYKYTKSNLPPQYYCSQCVDAMKAVEAMIEQSELEYKERLARFNAGELLVKPTNQFTRTPDLTNYKLTPLSISSASQCNCIPPNPATHKYTLHPERIDVYTCRVCLPKLTANLHPNQYTVVELTDVSTTT